ncbi:metal-dependent hydrolase family protein [Streptomyces mutabilis]|uniref:metal-dependent hydrolase family protein n=1 Tax=Streptomyces mutabilis TaxID=67332 RepID=UPI003985E2F8
MPRPLLLKNAHVLDPESGSYREADVLCADGLIQQSEGKTKAPQDAMVMDVAGAFVVPGLIDAHVHVAGINADTTALRTMAPSYIAIKAARRMEAMLRRGFTTVRDVGGADFGMAQAQQDGLVQGPRLVFGGKALSQTGGHGDKRSPGVQAQDDHPFCGGSCRVVDGVEGVRLATREELRRGAHHIKVMASGGVASPTDHIDAVQYSEAELTAIVDEAHAAGTYVTVHAYTAAAINRALRVGARCVEHGNLLDDQSVELLLSNEAFLVPTLVTYWALRREGRDHGLSEYSWAKAGEVLEGSLSALERADRAGVQIVFGTDLLDDMERHQSHEFRLRAQVQKPADIMRAATSTAARLLRQEGRLGTTTQGAQADLLVLRNDPLADIGVLAEPEKHLRHIIQAGRVLAQP